MDYRQISIPDTLPVDLRNVFVHLRLIIGDEADLNTAVIASEQDYVKGLILAASRYCESYTRRQLVPAGFEGYLDKYPLAGWFYLEKSPVIAVSKIETRDSTGKWVEMEKTLYDVDVNSEPARVSFKGQLPQLFFNFSNIKVTFSAGYGSVDEQNTLTAKPELIPETIKSAIKLIVGHLYEHREQVVMGVTTAEMPFGVDALLDTERLFLF